MTTQILSLIYSPSVELLMFIIVALIDIFLAFVVYRSNPKSATSVIFALLTLFTMLWLASIYVVRIPNLAGALVWHRLGIVVAAPHSVLFFLLAHTIPSDRILLRRSFFYPLLAVTAIVMLINISRFGFVGVTSSDGLTSPIAGPGIVPFALLAVSCSFLAVYTLVRKYFNSSGIVRRQVEIVLAGICIMLAFVIATILMPIALFRADPSLSLAPLYTLAFLGLAAYAITRYHLFNIKVLVTEAFALLLSVVLFAKIFTEKTLEAAVVDGLIFIFVVIFGYFLVQSVRREVEQRELIEKQELELEDINRQQESLLHFVSHEVKGYLTKSEAAFAAIFSGDYGDVSPKLHEMSGLALTDVRKGVDTVIDILDASNLRRGTVSFRRENFDIVRAIEEIVSDLEPAAKERGLELSFEKPVTGAYVLVGDEDKLRRHVIRNLIDNSVKYTLKGHVRVELSRTDDLVRMTITDTGVGITPEDMKHLFTEGGKGADSLKINVHSTGYGLFIAKTIVEGHGGRVWAESEGKDRGSRFIVELPTNRT